MNHRNCFSCGEEMESVFRKDDPVPQFNDAVMFEATGTYGSTVWDWVGTGKSLLINICDKCLVEKKDRVLVVHVHKPVPEVTYKPWDPDVSE